MVRWLRCSCSAISGLVSSSAHQYQWSPATPLARPDTSYTTGYLTATETFHIQVTDISSGCTGSDSITVFLRPVPQVAVSPNQTINARESVQLQASGAASYQWFPATWLDHSRRADPVATPQAPVTYTVIGANEYGCRDTATVDIQIRETLFVPNAFSPNGEGLNDVFAISNFGYQEVKSFRIFDRWGKEVFHTTNGLTGWNGNIKGTAAPADTYSYHIELRLRDDSTQILKGDLQLIR